MNELVFKAVADSRRRDILDLLVTTSEPMSIKQVAERFEISRQGIRKHIDILESARLLKTRTVGRDTLVYVDLRPLKDIDHWLDNYRQFWGSKLMELEAYLDKRSKQRR
jgi:predicted ArsR family transcriptional regulator